MCFIINCVLFVSILQALHRAVSARQQKGNGTQGLQTQSRRKEVQAAISVFFLLGLSWVFGALIDTGNDSTNLLFQYLFAIFVTLQGFVIFLMYCVFNDSVRDAVREASRSVAGSSGPSHSSGQVSTLKGNVRLHTITQAVSMDPLTLDRSANNPLAPFNRLQSNVGDTSPSDLWPSGAFSSNPESPVHPSDAKFQEDSVDAHLRLNAQDQPHPSSFSTATMIINFNPLAESDMAFLNNGEVAYLSAPIDDDVEKEYPTLSSVGLAHSRPSAVHVLLSERAELQTKLNELKERHETLRMPRPSDLARQSSTQSESDVYPSATGRTSSSTRKMNLSDSEHLFHFTNTEGEDAVVVHVNDSGKDTMSMKTFSF